MNSLTTLIPIVFILEKVEILERTIFMTLSILAFIVIVTTLPISYGAVKGISAIYKTQILKSIKMLKGSKA